MTMEVSLDESGSTAFTPTSEGYTQTADGTAASEVDPTEVLAGPIVAIRALAHPLQEAHPMHLAEVAAESRALIRLLNPRRRVDAADARRNFASLLKEVAQTKGSVMITRYGKTEAVLTAHATIAGASRILYRIGDVYARAGMTTQSPDELPDELRAAIQES